MAANCVGWLAATLGAVGRAADLHRRPHKGRYFALASGWDPVALVVMRLLLEPSALYLPTLHFP